MPPSDTLEALPEDFWGAPVTPASTPEPPPASAPAAPAADQTESHTDAGHAGDAAGGTIATLQRLFPGRVLRVEADEPTLELGADVEGAEQAAGAADGESPDSGLESPGSRDT